MWKIKYYYAKIKRRFTENPTGMDWLSLAIGLLNAYGFYMALLTGNMVSLIINGFFLYICFKNLTR